MKKYKKSVGADASVRPSSKARQNKGITLIALVITIIVMLILVAVTISMAINGGLFGYAGKAASDTKNAITYEQELANLETNMTVDELIDKYTGSSNEGVDLSLINVGDYVNYPVTYTNVATYDNSYIPSDEFSSWRVLAKETDEEGNTYIRLVSAGVPLSFYISSSSTVGVAIENLQNDFLNMEINSDTKEDGKFYNCGFSTGENTNLRNVFENNFTDSVRALMKEDIDAVLGTTSSTGSLLTDVCDNLFAIPCKGDNEGEFAYVDMPNDSSRGGLLGVNKLGKVFEDGGYGSTGFSEIEGGIRPVVTLKINVKFLPADTKINDITTWEISI